MQIPGHIDPVVTPRAITPRVVLDRHVPLAAFVALLSLWVIATIAKVNVCLEVGMELCK